MIKTRAFRRFSVRKIAHITLILLFSVLSPSAVSPANPLPGELYFIAVGDTGTGERGQEKVAEAMASSAESFPVEFVLLLGDNFYPRGVKSTEDPAWRKKFEDMYDQSSLQIPFYAVLGNHDYLRKPKAQVQYGEKSKRWKMMDRYYTFTRRLGDSTSIDFFALDTSALITKKDEKQVEWLEKALKKSQADWKIVFGHHPIYSHGKHGPANRLRNLVEDLFIKEDVSLYLAGHNHALEALQPVENVHYIVSGAGSQTTRIKKKKRTLFAKSILGFVLLRLTPEAIHVQFISKNKRDLFDYVIPKPSP